jgi:hypothetical protein
VCVFFPTLNVEKNAKYAVCMQGRIALCLFYFSHSTDVANADANCGILPL